MRKNTLLIGFVMGLLLLAGSAWASTSKHQAKDLTMSGTIVSSNASQLVLSSKANGKMEQETFVVNSSTKTKGTLASGEKATVHYQRGQPYFPMLPVDRKTIPAKG